MEPPNHQVSPPTLAEVGISKKESMVAQALAEVRDTAPEVFEQVRRGEVPIGKAREVARAAPRIVRAPAFLPHVETEALRKWLRARRESWPEPMRGAFVKRVRLILDEMEAADAND